jgi:hypothetical protein
LKDVSMSVELLKKRERRRLDKILSPQPPKGGVSDYY